MSAKAGPPSHAVPDSRSVIPPLIPDHELVRRIGKGSYGEVWLARNVMGTFRAVKILHRSAFREERPYEREYGGIKKFEPVSRSHAGFIDILHVGRNDEAGFFYYIMELGDDVEEGQIIHPEEYIPRTLTKAVAERARLPIDECVKLGLALTSALGYLHEQGLIHRDLKPSNIIFAGGVPKLADIGLVTDIGGAASYVGTEGFIPPEGPTSPMADLFSLGKILYEISTGQDRLDFPDLPHGLAREPDVERLLELNEIVVKACHRDPAKRYHVALEMHADLRILENGKSVRRLRVLEKRLTAIKRYGMAAALCLLAGGFGYLEWARRERVENAITERRVGAEIAYGCARLEAEDLLGSLPHFVETLGLLGDSPDQERAHRLRLGTTFAQCPKVVQMWSMDERANDVQFSPNGREVAVATYSKGVAVFDIASGQPVAPVFGRRFALETVRWSPDGKFALTASQDNTAVLWEVMSGKEIMTFRHKDRVHAAVFSPDGSLIASACTDGQVRLWNVSTGALRREMQAHAGIVLDVVFSPNGELLVSAGTDKRVRLWRVEDGQPVGEALEHRSWVYSVAVSPDGKRLATACFDRRARLWELPSGREVPSAMEHEDGVRSVTFTPDAAYLVTAGWDGTVRIWDAYRGLPALPNPVLKHSARVLRAVSDWDGRRIASACIDGTVRVWDLAGSQVVPEKVEGLPGHGGSRVLRRVGKRLEIAGSAGSRPAEINCGETIEEAAFDRSGNFVLTLTRPETMNNTLGVSHLRVWEATSGMPRSPPIRYGNRLSKMDLQQDGMLLAHFDGTNVNVVEVATGQEVFPALKHRVPLTQIAFNPKGHSLLTVAGAQVRVWDTTSGQELFPALPHAHTVAFAAFSPDGRLIVACPRDQTLAECAAQVWMASSGQPVGRPLPHRDGVLSATFSPDSRKVITTGEDFQARIWDVETGLLLTAPLKHNDRVSAACFSADGGLVATVARDGTALIWDVESGAPLTPPLRHKTPLERIEFGQGDTIFTYGEGDQVWKWRLSRDDHSLDDLSHLIRTYCGDPNVLSKAEHEEEKVSIGRSWEHLAKAHPSDIQVSQAQIAAWHAHQVEAAKKDKHWDTAKFHLDRLLASDPANHLLLEDREKVVNLARKAGN